MTNGEIKSRLAFVGQVAKWLHENVIKDMADAVGYVDIVLCPDGYCRIDAWNNQNQYKIDTNGEFSITYKGNCVGASVQPDFVTEDDLPFA